MADAGGDVWIQLYIGREPDGFFSVTGLYANVDELKEAVWQECQPELEYCAAHDLKIYKNGTTFDDAGNGPLDIEDPVPKAESKTEALIVVAPPKYVWIQLYIGREPAGNITSVTGLYANVDKLKEAVKQKCPTKLEYCDARDLDIYPHGTTFDDFGKPNKGPLNPRAKVPEDETGDETLIVVAPEQQQQDQRLQKPVTERRIISISYKIAETNLDYKVDLNLFQKYVDYVFDEYYNAKDDADEANRFLAPYFPFVQSSGMGKTKLLYHFAEANPCETRWRAKHQGKDWPPVDKPKYSSILILCRGNINEEHGKEDLGVFDKVFDCKGITKLIAEGDFDEAFQVVDSKLDEMIKGQGPKVVLLFDESNELLKTLKLKGDKEQR
eukprot:scaffold7395_cov73-Cylindrotheca_fusiformis.AAC.1